MQIDHAQTVIEEEVMIGQKCIIYSLHYKAIFHRTVTTVTEVAYDILWAWSDGEVPQVISFLRSC